jgi:3-hydroxyacyl-[acyl-carrier protein] dehydratase / trans-2-decenoyl-[acyl-carrier protein] isomerase
MRPYQSRLTFNCRPPITKGLVLPNPHDFHTPQSSYTKEDLLKSSEGGYFGPGNAQLPAPPMLMMDRITEISMDGGEFGNGHIIGQLDITPSLWFFNCHFPGDPVMPGCLGLDAMLQMIGYWLGWSGSPGKGRAIGVGEVKFRGHITVEIRRVRYEVDMRQVRRGKLAVGIANGRVLADDTCVYVAKDMRVGLIMPAI